MVSQVPGWYGVVRGSGVGVALVAERLRRWPQAWPHGLGRLCRDDDGYVLLSRPG